MKWFLRISQTCQKEEVKIKYLDGFEVFNVCVNNPQIAYDDNREYYWYTEFSKIKSTKGGSGGQLLHGNYKFYDEKGNLLREQNYSLGLEHGEGKIWDSEGNIKQITKSDNGDYVYWKFKSEDGEYWVEHVGRIFHEGWVKKTYNNYNILLSEEKMLDDFKTHVKVYYDYNGQLQEEFTSDIGGTFYFGDFTAYHKNGRISIEGQFYDGNTVSNVRVGTWKWFNEDGSLNEKLQYKAEVEHWPNGVTKMVGGYIYDSSNQKWIKTGEWRWYSDDGKFLSSKEYKWGVEVPENEWKIR